MKDIIVRLTKSITRDIPATISDSAIPLLEKMKDKTLTEEEANRLQYLLDIHTAEAESLFEQGEYVYESLTQKIRWESEETDNESMA